jgi:hypothetical protein
MTFNTLTFGDFDPVTGAPTVDGLTAIPDAGVVTNEVESGYVQGGRLTFGSSSGLPPVIIDAIRRDGNFLQLGVFCRFDLSFDEADTIVVALKPTPGASQGSAVRFDLQPLRTNLDGAGPDGDVDDDPSGLGIPAGAHYHIRRNRLPIQLTHWHGVDNGPNNQRWTQTPTASLPQNVEAKVRSWKPPTAPLTKTPPSPAPSQDLRSDPPFTFNVLSTADFPKEGLFAVDGTVEGNDDVHSVRFTGKTPTSFTGCTSDGGKVAPNTDVSIPEVGWSVEIKIPLTTRADSGGPNWIDLASEFGLFISVIRAGVTEASGSQLFGGLHVVQHIFPANADALIDNLDEKLFISAYGAGRIPSEGGNAAAGVEIFNGELGIGARLASAAAGTQFGNTIDRTNNNVFVTQVRNTADSVANRVTSEVRIANWGMPPASFDAWGRPPGAAPNPSAPENVQAGTSPVELRTLWDAAQIPAAYADHPHQCIWVQLSSDSAVDFTSSSDRRNMDFAPLSSIERDAEISGVGYPSPPNGINHEFVLIMNSRVIRVLPPIIELSGGQPDAEAPFLTGIESADDKVIFLFIVHGYRVTGETLRIGTRTFKVLDPTPGSCGFISEHQGSGDVLTTTLTGTGLTGEGNVRILKVPHNGTTTIRTRIEAGPAKPAPDDDDHCDDDDDDDDDDDHGHHDHGHDHDDEDDKRWNAAFKALAELNQKLERLIQRLERKR